MNLKRVIIIHMERSTCLHYFYISNRSAILLILINKYQPSNVKSLDSKTTFGSSELRFVVDRNCLCSKLSMNTWSTLWLFKSRSGQFPVHLSVLHSLHSLQFACLFHLLCAPPDQVGQNNEHLCSFTVSRFC